MAEHDHVGEVLAGGKDLGGRGRRRLTIDAAGGEDGEDGADDEMGCGLKEVGGVVLAPISLDKR